MVNTFVKFYRASCFENRKFCKQNFKTIVFINLTGKISAMLDDQAS